MLKQLFETQISVLKQGLAKLLDVKWLETFRTDMSSNLDKIDDDYLPQTDRMIRDLKRLQKSVLDLLDLQQKEENIREARNANQQALFTAEQALSAQAQADATDAQSQILFIFTVVTIVFLPLSFFTSYFGMFNINNEDGKGVEYSRSYVNKAMWGASGPIIAIFLLGAVLWYCIGKRQSAQERTRGLIKLEDDGDLPDKLLSESDPERKNMKNMRAKRNRPPGLRRYLSASYLDNNWEKLVPEVFSRLSTKLNPPPTAQNTVGAKPPTVVEKASPMVSEERPSDGARSRKRRPEHGEDAVSKQAVWMPLSGSPSMRITAVFHELLID